MFLEPSIFLLSQIVTPEAQTVAAAENRLLFDLFILFGLALAVTFVCDRFRIPAIVGFLLTGILAGPYVLGWVTDTASIDMMAQIGVILLLFSTGIEFSFRSLMQIKFPFFIGGSLQLAITSLATVGIALFVGRPLNEAIFWAFLVSLSCTAIALKMLQQRAEMDSPHGRLSVGILLFQDFMVVPMVILTPLLAGVGAEMTPIGGDGTLGSILLRAAMVLVIIFVAARYIIPLVFHGITAMRDREVFLLSVIFVGLGIAVLTASIGLSLALGAFIAGLIISESEYSQRALGSIIPFREVFISLFFISIGMLLDLDSFARNPLPIILLSAVVILIKIAMAILAVLFLGYPLKVAILTSFSLSGIGEFSFVLSKTGLDTGLLTNQLFQDFLAISVISLIAAPFIIALGPIIARKLKLEDIRDRISFSAKEEAALEEANLTDHIIIVGFGPTGRYIARAATTAGIPYLVIEMNPQTVRTERKKGQPIFYGDAGQEIVLQKSGLERARVLLLVIADPAASRRITQMARALNPGIKIIARMRFIAEMQPLMDLGADEVIPEEFETAVELVTRMMQSYLLPIEQIQEFVGELRANSYRLLRDMSATPRVESLQGFLPDIDLFSFRLKDRPYLVGKTLTELEMRSRFGLTVLAIRRAGETISNPDPEIPLQQEDELVVMGSSRMLSTMSRKLTNTPIPPPGTG